MPDGTKYSKGDVFIHPTDGVWTLLDWMQVSPTAWRWQININFCGLDTKAWTDDYWLDKLEKVEA